MSRSDKFVAAAWMTFFVVGWADSICWPSVGWQVGLAILVVGIVFVLVLVSLAAREEAKAWGWRHPFRF